MTLLNTPGDARALIHELSEPIPAPPRGRFFDRVRKLLSGDEILSPAKIVDVCRQVQIEMRVAPAVELEGPSRPSAQPPRSPFRRRA